MYNLIYDGDSYKYSHWLQDRKNTVYKFSYGESRGTSRDYVSTVFSGLQYFVKEYLTKPVTMEMVEEVKEMCQAHGEPFNYEGWKLMVERHKGFFPVKIRAVPEGTVVPNKNALYTVESTDADFAWTVSFIETAISRIWYSITVATQSHYLKRYIYGYLMKTSDDPDAEINFKLHDFGSRGASSQETAMLGGASHLISFWGTDTFIATKMLRDYYNTPMAGFSIPASEHSTISAWGREFEVDAYRNMLKQFAKKGNTLAVVSDTWDIFNACENIWGGELKQEVIDSGATVVIRPDSGDPVEVLCGKPKNKGDRNNLYASEQEQKGVLNILAEKFGYTINTKGYKVLNNVRVIQGDGVNPTSIAEILREMEGQGFSATNIAFGMGGALLQKVDRDVQKMAYKCSYTINDLGGVDVYKDPITDPGKKSKKGRLDLIKVDGEFQTVKLEEGQIQHPDSEFVTYYWNGQVLVDDDFATIRERAKIY
jgi:nicotinamide phosphoribosyltransferase